MLRSEQSKPTREDALARARRAINDLASSDCDCPYETERELAVEIRRLRQDNEDLRHALEWAMSNVDDPKPDPFSDVLSEYAKAHRVATRLAWPDQPENWS